MRTFLKATGVALVCLTTLSAQAQTKFLTSGTYIANDTTYQNGEIYVGLDSDFTRTDDNGHPYSGRLNVVSGGDVRVAMGFDSGVINISGGHVNQAQSNSSDAATYGSSTLNISGGLVDTATATEGGNINISGGTVTALRAYTSSNIHITGGDIDDIFFGQGLVTCSVYGGNINRLDSYTANYVVIYGGTFNDIIMEGTSVASIRGGVISSNSIYAKDNAIIELYGSNFSLSSAQGTFSDNSGTYTLYHVTGTLTNGDTLNTSFRDYVGGNEIGSNNAPLQFFAVAPEPGSFALFGIAALPLAGLIRRRKP